MREVGTLPSTEALVTAGLRGHVLAEDIDSPLNIPTSPTTNVDGYALRGKKSPFRLVKENLTMSLQQARHPESTL